MSNPEADAGILATSTDAHIHAANTAHAAKRGDRRAVLGAAESEAVVGVIHNGIRPHHSLAALAA